MFAMLATYSWGQHIELSMDTVDVKEVFFNQTVQDPYRYFENTTDPRTKEYAQFQDQKAEDFFSANPLAKKYQRYLEKIDSGAKDDIGKVKVSESGAYFYLKMEERDYSWKIYYRPSLTGADRMLFNPEKFDRKSRKEYEITDFQPSWDGKKLLIAIASEHSHTSEIVILDVSNGNLNKTGIENSRPQEYYGMQWTPSAESFTYTALDNIDPSSPKSKLNSSLSLYTLKTGTSRIIFGNSIAPNTDNRLFPVTQINSSNDRFIIVYTGGPSNFWDSYYTSFDDLSNETPSWKSLLTFDDKAYGAKGKIKGNDYYFISQIDSSKVTISSIDLSAKIPIIKEVVKSKTDLITDFLLVNEDIYYTTSKYGVEASLFCHHEQKSAKIDLPSKSSKIKLTKASNNLIWIDAETPLSSVKNYTYSKETAVNEEHFYMPGSYPEFKDLVYDLVEIESYDGEMVPMSIIRAKELVFNGDNPVFSNSYGAFGSNDDISYQTHLLSFVSAGGILVYPHIRGGGAKGEKWHEAGKKDKKYNSWKDLIACMDYLVKNKYTTHSKITLFGESAGSIATAMAVNERPDISGTLIVGSGVFNPYRKESVYKSASFVEYGTMTDSIEAKGLIAMDPYLNIPKKTIFPSTLVLHGLKDDRIYLHEPLKYIAKMQKNHQGENPILLDLDPNGNHNSVTDFYEYFGRIFSFAFSESNHNIGI